MGTHSRKSYSMKGFRHSTGKTGFGFLVIGVMTVCMLRPATAFPEAMARHVEKDVSIQVDLREWMNNDIRIATLPLHGKAYIPEKEPRFFYYPDSGFEGFDRVVVTGTKDGNPEKKIFYLTVGAPFLSRTEDFYGRVAELLFALAVVAIFLEIALSALFRNRAFQKLDAFPGIKTTISFVVGLLIVFSFDFNIFKDVMNALQRDASKGGAWSAGVSGVISALLLAGGSSTVFYLYTKLGLRNPFKSDKNLPGLTGPGTLKVTVVRGGNIADTEPVAIELNDRLASVLAGGQSIFGSEKGYQIEAGVYTVRAKANDKHNQPAEVSRMVAIEPNKPLEIELAFS